MSSAKNLKKLLTSASLITLSACFSANNCVYAAAVPEEIIPSGDVELSAVANWNNNVGALGNNPVSGSWIKFTAPGHKIKADAPNFDILEIDLNGQTPGLFTITEHTKIGSIYGGAGSPNNLNIKFDADKTLTFSGTSNANAHDNDYSGLGSIDFDNKSFILNLSKRFTLDFNQINNYANTTFIFGDGGELRGLFDQNADLRVQTGTVELANAGDHIMHTLALPNVASRLKLTQAGTNVTINDAIQGNGKIDFDNKGSDFNLGPAFMLSSDRIDNYLNTTFIFANGGKLQGLFDQNADLTVQTGTVELANAGDHIIHTLDLTALASRLKLMQDNTNIEINGAINGPGKIDFNNTQSGLSLQGDATFGGVENAGNAAIQLLDNGTIDAPLTNLGRLLFNGVNSRVKLNHAGDHTIGLLGSKVSSTFVIADGVNIKSHIIGNQNQNELSLEFEGSSRIESGLGLGRNRIGDVKITNGIVEFHNDAFINDLNIRNAGNNDVGARFGGVLESHDITVTGHQDHNTWLAPVGNVTANHVRLNHAVLATEGDLIVTTQNPIEFDNGSELQLRHNLTATKGVISQSLNFQNRSVIYVLNDVTLNAVAALENSSLSLDVNTLTAEQNIDLIGNSGIYTKIGNNGATMGNIVLANGIIFEGRSPNINVAVDSDSIAPDLIIGNTYTLIEGKAPGAIQAQVNQITDTQNDRIGWTSEILNGSLILTAKDNTAAMMQNIVDNTDQPPVGLSKELIKALPEKTLNQLGEIAAKEGSNAASNSAEKLRGGPPAQNTVAQNVVSDITTMNNNISGRMYLAQAVAGGDEVMQNNRGIWVRPLFLVSSTKAHDGMPGYKTSGKGISLGFDRMIGDNFLAGVAGAFVKNDVKYQDRLAGDKTKINSYLLSLYGNKTFGKSFFAQGIFSTSLNHSKNHAVRGAKSIGFDVAQSKGRIKSYSAEVMMGHNNKLGAFTLTPMFGGSYSKYFFSGYTEKGSSFANFKVDKSKFDKAEAIIGLKSDIVIEGAGHKLTPQVYGFIHKDLLHKKPKIRAVLTESTNEFPIKNATASKNSYNIGSNLTFKKSIYECEANYDFGFAKNYKSHQMGLKLKVNF